MLATAVTFLAVLGGAHAAPLEEEPARCTNTGVIVSVGSYDCGGAACLNRGLVIWVGTTCHAEGALGACATKWCFSLEEVAPV